MKKCIYCKSQLDESSVIDVCRSCGLQVWGKNMFDAIVQNMEGARDEGNLYQGSVSTTPKQERRPTFQQQQSFSQPQQNNSPQHQSFSQPRQNNSAPQRTFSPQQRTTSSPQQRTTSSCNAFTQNSSLVLDAIKTQQELLEESKKQSSQSFQ